MPLDEFVEFFLAGGERENIIHFEIIFWIGSEFVGILGKCQFILFETEQLTYLRYLVAGKAVGEIGRAHV